jgi:hypothetical protein
MIISLAGMGGIAPKVTPELLPDNMAQTASNVILHNGGVASLSNTTTVATPTKAGTAVTIYRFGRNQPETQYWFKWTTPVNVARGPIAGDTEETTYYTGDGLPKKTRFSLATSSGTDYPVAYYNLKVPAPTAAPTLTLVGGTGPVVSETRAYVYTNVSAWGEESSPSPASIIEVSSTGVAQLSGFSAVPTGSYSITQRYIYRSVTSSSGTNYYFVGSISSVATTFTDAVDIASVGEPLPSLDWDEPPDDLFGLICHPSGAMWGISGKEICPSVIGAPYAFPQKWRLTCDFNPVALATMGQGVIVLTDGLPYFINTGDPESAQMIRIDEEQACVSARSVVQFGGGVVYASPDGLMSITQSGVTNLTDKHFDRKAWQALNPSTLFGVKHDNRYYGFFATGGFVLDTSGNFTLHTINATSAYVDPVLDQLFVAVGNYINKWDSGTALTHTWKSKRFNLPKLTAFSCVQIKANSFANLTFKLYAGGVLKYTKVVTSADPFRLPSGFKSRLYEFEITGTDHWTSAHIAQSMEELKNV